MQGKVVLVTGGNAGIGLETVRALFEKGAHVFFTSRHPAQSEETLEAWAATAPDVRERVRCLPLDLSDFASIEALSDQLDATLVEMGRPLDVLVNNAGLIVSKRQTTAQGFEMMLGVNHLGHFYLTHRLLPKLLEADAARVVNVASDAHRSTRGLNFDDLMSERRFAAFDVYAKSKLANIYFTRELANRLSGTKVTTNALHPGVVATRFARDGDAKGPIGAFFTLAKPFLLTPAKGARTSVHLASSPEVASVSGKYFARCRPVTPSKRARDGQSASRLWSVSERLVRDAGGTWPDALSA